MNLSLSLCCLHLLKLIINNLRFKWDRNVAAVVVKHAKIWSTNTAVIENSWGWGKTNFTGKKRMMYFIFLVSTGTRSSKGLFLWNWFWIELEITLNHCRVNSRTCHSRTIILTSCIVRLTGLKDCHVMLFCMLKWWWKYSAGFQSLVFAICIWYIDVFLWIKSSVPNSTFQIIIGLLDY